MIELLQNDIEAIDGRYNFEPMLKTMYFCQLGQ